IGPSHLPAFHASMWPRSASRGNLIPWLLASRYSNSGDEASRIEDVLRIECQLEAAHQPDCRLRRPVEHLEVGARLRARCQHAQMATRLMGDLAPAPDRVTDFLIGAILSQKNLGDTTRRRGAKFAAAGLEAARQIRRQHRQLRYDRGGDEVEVAQSLVMGDRLRTGQHLGIAPQRITDMRLAVAGLCSASTETGKHYAPFRPGELMAERRAQNFQMAQRCRLFCAPRRRQRLRRRHARARYMEEGNRGGIILGQRAPLKILLSYNP